MSEEFAILPLPATETACIEVPKVYDFCFEADRRENVCTPLGICRPPVGAAVGCTITSTTCTEVSRTTPDTTGRANVTFAVTVIYTLRVTAPETECTIFSNELTFTKTINLCAPEGTFTNCEVVNSACTCLILGEQICCTFDLCIVVQSLAIVKLLVPVFGFCTPAVCEQVSPAPPFICPPALFPPQCTRLG